MDNELPSASIPSTPSLQLSTAITNTSNKQLSQSSNNSTIGKPNMTSGPPSQPNPFTVLNKTSKYLILNFYFRINRANKNSIIMSYDTNSLGSVSFNMFCNPNAIFLDY